MLCSWAVLEEHDCVGKKRRERRGAAARRSGRIDDEDGILENSSEVVVGSATALAMPRWKSGEVLCVSIQVNELF
jgi:hypothetical protein